jgi:pimeloyl-ACP methyl ester carboxylesterase
MVTFFVTLAAVLLVVYALAVFVATYVSLHPPRVPLWISPAFLGFPEEKVKLESDGVELTGWWSDCGDGGLVVVCCHGYLMNRCELLPMMVTLADLKASWLFFDFRAHGKSQGRTCTMGKAEALDVAAAARFVREHRPGAQIVLYGSSMGGAAAAIALGEDPDLADALILDGAYSSMDEAGRGWWNFLGGKWLALVLAPTVWLGRLMVGFNPASVVVADYLTKAQHRPVLFLAGDDDPIVSQGSLDRNVKASGELTWVEMFQGAGHGEARFREPVRYRDSIRRFVLENVLKEAGP